MSHQIVRGMPLLGVLGGIALLALAAARYPGEEGWTRLTASALCAGSLPNGGPNPVRTTAAIGLLLLCAGTALLFQLIAFGADTRAQQKTIQIAGVGSMVYALLTATPMHNLMVTIALAFHLVAMLGIMGMLFSQRRLPLLWLGLLCLAAQFAIAAIYYAGAYTSLLGVLQKTSFALCTSWLFAVLFTARTHPATQPQT